MIEADFDGAERQFEIKPESVALFEATLPGRSAVALLRKFTVGEWTAHDVAHVLSFALHGPTRDARQAWDFARLATRHGLPGVAIPYRPHPDVVAAVTASGPANFAPLAADILTEVLFREVPADDAA